MIEVGTQFKFIGYSTAPPDGDAIFHPRDVGVIAAIDSEDGTFRCFVLGQDGKPIPTKGDTLFLEEIRLLPDAPKVPLGGDEE